MTAGRPCLAHATFVGIALPLATVHALTTGAPPRAAVVTSSLVSALVVLALVLRRRLTPARPWWFVVAGLAVLTAHNAVSLVQVGLQGRPAGTGLLSAVSLPAGYVLMLTGAALIAFPYARKDVGGILDAIIVSLGAGSLAWTFVLHPTLTARDAAVGERLYTLTVLLLVTGIGGAVLRIRVSARGPGPSLDYMLLAIVLTLVGTVARTATRDAVTGVAAGWIGVVWVFAYVALAAAALHPSQAHITVTPRSAGRLSTRRLVFLSVVLSLNPTIAGVQEARGQEADWVLLTLATLILVPLVTVRIAQLARLHADAEVRLAHLAAHDELTGLANRRTVMKRLAEALERVHAGRSPGAVLLFLDLDDFKVVNDEHGHPVGDQLLVTVAQRLLRAMRSEDTVARFGGDEFIVLCEGVPEGLAAQAVVRVQEALADPVRLGDLLVPCRASIGVAMIDPGNRTTADQLLSAADAHMYEHKRRVRAVGAPQDAAEARLVSRRATD